jgi:uncharacterized cofD-like protein
MKTPFAKRAVRVAVIGGGTGSFMILSALKQYTGEIAAIVSMADDGGSTGVLRDEFGTLPPGDVRQCLVALSDSPKVRDLFDYRFEASSFKGHSFGNILLTALEKIEGDFGSAVETASEILRVNGMVIPATLDNVRLKMEWADKSLILHGERVIDAEFFKHDPRQAELSLVPTAAVNPTAIVAIEQADIIIIAPGDLYTSLGPLLVIDGIGDALMKSHAMKVYVSNLVTKQGQTDGFDVSDHAAEIERFAGGRFLDYVLYNDTQPDAKTTLKYKEEGAYTVKADRTKLNKAHYIAIASAFLGGSVRRDKKDTFFPATRSLIRHDAEAVMKKIFALYQKDSSRDV